MTPTIHVAVHSSQFPESAREALLECLRRRSIAPKFLYQSHRQAQLWLALHRAHSPAWLDPDCAAIYERAFAAAAGAAPNRPARLIGLGCGGGYKEARLLRALAAAGRKLSYVPCDVSLPLVLESAREAAGACPGLSCQPLVCDVSLADDLPEILSQAERDEQRILTFFGMIPNFEPAGILARLAKLVRPGDLLLLSANLAPGPDYRAGVLRVLPGYDNPETRAWLLAFLFDLGVEPGDGAAEFSVEAAAELYRIVADFHFARERALEVYERRFLFRPGDSVRLFFSYRYTPDRIRLLLGSHQLGTPGQWITASGEEGVFLCQREDVPNLNPNQNP
jgi:SAM-dependent methyltransferase